MLAVALIGDIVGSRRAERREALQRTFIRTVARINRFAAAQGRVPPISPFTVTLGDEVQALFRDPTDVFVDAFALRALMWPVEMRFCVAVGSITTPINRTAAIGMDGPAFYAAREGIEQLKRSNGTFAVRAHEDLKVDLEDVALRLADATTLHWRETRHRVLFGVLQGHNVVRLAKELNISRTAIYKNLSDGHVHLLHDTAQAAGASLRSRFFD